MVAEFLSRTNSPIEKTNISTAVRSEEQVQSLSKLGINVIELDLSDEVAVNKAIIGNESVFGLWKL